MVDAPKREGDKSVCMSTTVQLHEASHQGDCSEDKTWYYELTLGLLNLVILNSYPVLNLRVL